MAVQAAVRPFLALLIGAVAFAAAGCGGDSTDAASLDCGKAAFSAEPTDAALDIKATGVACETAVAVARGANRVDVAAENLNYTTAGFDCTGTLVTAGISYRCENEDQVVTFIRT